LQELPEYVLFFFGIGCVSYHEVGELVIVDGIIKVLKFWITIFWIPLRTCIGMP
jgi:hypothetical protein